MFSRSFSCGCLAEETETEQLQVREFCFDTSEKVGCTQILRGEQRNVRGQAVDVAGKVISEQQLEDFMALEGRAWAVLAREPHESILTLRDTAETADARGVLVFDSVHQDLHSYVRGKGKLSETEARHHFRQLVMGVAHCHSHRVVLRDLKLGKIFFTTKDCSRLVIGDLDGAQVIPEDGHWQLRDQKGSPAYVSPEVLTCAPYDGAQADVWSLGVILYVMLTGYYPFQDHRPELLFHKIHRGSAAVKFPKTLSPSVVELLHALLNKDPSQRPTAEGLLLDPWMLDSTSLDCVGETASPLSSSRASPSLSAMCGDYSSRLSPMFCPVVAKNDKDDQVVPIVTKATKSLNFSSATQANSASSTATSRGCHLSSSLVSCSRKRKRGLSEGVSAVLEALSGSEEDNANTNPKRRALSEHEVELISPVSVAEVFV